MVELNVDVYSLLPFIIDCFVFQAIFAPLFKFINNLPQDLILTAVLNDAEGSADTQTVSLCGRGIETSLCSLLHNSWYLVRFSYLLSPRGVVSPPFPLSTCIANQLPSADGIDCGVWPYNKCTSHRYVYNYATIIRVSYEIYSWEGGGI